MGEGSEVLARVRFRLEPGGADLVAELVRDGWRIPGAGPELAELPAALGRLMLFIDGAGDPIAAAAAEAARMLCGRVEFIRRSWS